MPTPQEQGDFRDQTEFVLEKEQWERFMELVDRPARIKPELRRLFSEPSIFSGQ
jgi:uncharacterized protein (DUF1778 family)